MKKLFAILSVVLFANQASAEFMEIGGVYFCESNFARYYTRSEGDKVEKLYNRASQTSFTLSSIRHQSSDNIEYILA